MMKSTIVGINSWTQELLLEIIPLQLKSSFLTGIDLGPYAHARAPFGGVGHMA